MKRNRVCADCGQTAPEHDPRCSFAVPAVAYRPSPSVEAERVAKAKEAVADALNQDWVTIRAKLRHHNDCDEIVEAIDAALRVWTEATAAFLESMR